MSDQQPNNNSSRRKKILLILLASLVAVFVLLNYVLLPWYVNQGGNITVPAVVGMGFDGAKKILDGMHLEAVKAEVRLDMDHPAGSIISQNPAANEQVKRGRRIYLVISGGDVVTTVPPIRGKTIRDARFALEREGLKMGTMEYAASDSFPQNTIIEQRPPAGVRIRKDAFISVVISQGSVSQKIAVPDFTRKNLKEVTSLLVNSGLKLGNITYLSSPDLLPNTVIEQYPRAGDLVVTGQAIDLFVVQGGEQKKEQLEN
ncbi:MAG TPA: PASTA domain-containing protein [Bacteroidota bacterium]|nr:PASTA domain-containing protein [Bacteroidota bacterium]